VWKVLKKEKESHNCESRTETQWHTRFPDWKTWQSLTRYRAWEGDFQTWHVWQNFGVRHSRVTAFYWNHNGTWNLFSKKLWWIKTFIRFFWVAPLPRLFSDVTKDLIQSKTYLKGPIGHCREPTSQHSEKTWELNVITDVADCILKPLKPEITPKNAKRQQLTENQKNTKNEI